VEVDSVKLLPVMRIEYIHFLHRLTTMGLLPTRKCGVFRKTSVHIEANPDLFFPIPSTVPGLMEQFCAKFPRLLHRAAAFDTILAAAQMSHRFVSIHPYSDGNGRMSRLLMNLAVGKSPSGLDQGR